MDPWDWNSPLIPIMEEKYSKLGQMRNNYLSEWEKFAERVRAMDGVYEVRDSSFQHGNHILSVKVRMAGPGCKGLVLFVSMLGVYGVHFADYQKQALVPLEDGSKKVWYSYYPYDEEGEIFARKLLYEVGKLFQDYSKFDNLYASIRVKNIHLDHLEKELDLFSAIFTNNIFFL
ncbi:hypothetical protein MM236_04335 [Belliella sp. DSM 107340]|uniref:Uncharacterized protein n=1 Tax=Belliella calami TaxID=2923436 RepID=A0ABS9UKQ4_9BACT|nr:hypothetical protein [Belliella calami]MCH7397201.1 hypothetical protein [Belliella calami]